MKMIQPGRKDIRGSWIAGLILAVCSYSYAESLPVQKINFGLDTCTPQEKWMWKSADGQNQLQKWKSEFDSTLTGKSATIRGFSEALALRRLATEKEEVAFSEYWTSRSLFS